MCMDESNKEKTLADAFSKIETLSAENTKLGADLQNANARVLELESELNAEKTAHASAKETLSALENKHRDIDKEVAAKAAQIAAESGVSPIETATSNSGEESIEELAKRIDAAHGIEKAKLIEANADRISAHLKGMA